MLRSLLTKRTQLILVSLALFVVPVANAQSIDSTRDVYDVDIAHSKVTFTLGATLHTVAGTFQLKSGSVRVNTATGDASGLIVVDAASGDSGSEARDRRMSQQILESGKFPQITFAPTHVKGALAASGESKPEIDGQFTIHGASHSLTASAVVTRTATRFKANLNFTVPYVQWGMKDPSNFLFKVKDQVTITLLLTGTVASR